MPNRPSLFIALDGEDEPTLWRTTDGNPSKVLRRCDLPVDHHDLWERLAQAAVDSVDA